MSIGALIFAHNNRDVDYALMAIISGGLAKKHLNIPVTLVSDKTTIDWMNQSGIFSKATEVFEKIIEVEKPVTGNTRKLHDGVETSKAVPFVNANRSSAWDLTPYDRTLLIDCDYFIFSDSLLEYIGADEDILISCAINDVVGPERVGYHDKYISDTGVHLYWATTVIFTKNERSKSFFDMVTYVKENYEYYADLFRFDPRQYRNDISFSVAKHILNGFETDLELSLPPVLTAIDKDILHSVNSDGKLTFLISTQLGSDYCAAAFKGRDIHIMNKQSVVRNAQMLLELI